MQVMEMSIDPLFQILARHGGTAFIQAISTTSTIADGGRTPSTNHVISIFLMAASTFGN
jgi:hypothetical protein